ncbi:MAG: nitrilase-related carbon-nitrogen hydrolase [Pirellulaceae bacterium]
MILEMGQAQLGLTWATTNSSLAIATTPIAQWSGILTPFGLSGVLYYINFLWLPDYSRVSYRRWSSSLLAISLTSMLWFGGMLIESTVVVQPLPFTAAMVQPHLHQPHRAAPWQPWEVLHPLTLASLEHDGPVDLIVWPESSLVDTTYSSLATAVDTIDDYKSPPARLTLADFRSDLLPQYRTNCLLGVAMLDLGTVTKYGLKVPEQQRYNCGCLMSSSAEIDCHEKLILVPMKEGLPRWLQNDTMRRWILPFFELTAPCVIGRDFHLLSFKDASGKTRTIAPVVCYESWHPWLPQFHQEVPLDAIVYMMYDGDFVDHPELIQRQLLSVRLRAIETRTWNLVCSTWRGTAIIDPRGRIVKELPPVAGVLRTDEL